MKKITSVFLIVSMLIAALSMSMTAFAAEASAEPALLGATGEVSADCVTYTFDVPTIVTVIKVSGISEFSYKVEYSADGKSWKAMNLYTQSANEAALVEAPVGDGTVYDTRSTYAVSALRIVSDASLMLSAELTGYVPAVKAGSRIVEFDLGADDANVFYSDVYANSSGKTYNPASVFNFTVGSAYNTDPTGGIFVSKNAKAQFVGCVLSEEAVITDITFSARTDKDVANNRYENHVFKASAVGDVNADGKIDATDIAEWDTVAAVASGFSTEKGGNNTVYTLSSTSDATYRYVAYYNAEKAYIDISSFEVYGTVKATEPEVTEPEVTEPEVTEPEVTEPEVTEPEVTEPEVTEPEVTEPEVTEPEVTEPAETEPEVTKPNPGTGDNAVNVIIVCAVALTALGAVVIIGKKKSVN
ncbi:MAG: hypothetical protein IJD70_10185 [Clostridia bacterium]|nr:hypothetical protein [Clostridia bacterium]